MAEYIGSKCIVCDKQFTKDDEIVVCPVCGTPYHRDCYLKEGKCINTELHEKNQSWQSLNSKTENNSDEKIICRRCGEQNPQTGLFCSKCGFPLGQTTQNDPFLQGNASPFGGMGQNYGNSTQYTKESKIDGIEIKDYNEYVQKNQLYFLSQFIRFDKLKSKFSINITAMFFPQFYFFYRKMNLQGLIFFILNLLVSTFSAVMLITNGYFDNTILADTFKFNISNSEIDSIYPILTIVKIGIMFICAFFANWWYYKKVKKDISEISNEDISGSEKSIKIKEKGGVSTQNLILSIVLFLSSLAIILTALTNI